MKKLLLIVLIFVCSIGLTACGAEEDMLGISFDQKEMRQSLNSTTQRILL